MTNDVKCQQCGDGVGCHTEDGACWPSRVGLDDDPCPCTQSASDIYRAEIERLAEVNALQEQVMGDLCKSCGWAFVVPLTTSNGVSGFGCLNCLRSELTAERDRLAAENATLAAERDQARADAVLVGRMRSQELDDYKVARRKLGDENATLAARVKELEGLCRDAYAGIHDAVMGAPVYGVPYLDRALSAMQDIGAMVTLTAPAAPESEETSEPKPDPVGRGHKRHCWTLWDHHAEHPTCCIGKVENMAQESTACGAPQPKGGSMLAGITREHGS